MTEWLLSDLLWTAGRPDPVEGGEPRLRAGRCTGCERSSFPSVGNCTWCGQTTIDFSLPSTGTLVAATAVRSFRLCGGRARLLAVITGVAGATGTILFFAATHHGFLAVTAVLTWWACNAFTPLLASTLAADAAAAAHLAGAGARELAALWQARGANAFNLGGRYEPLSALKQALIRSPRVLGGYI